MKKRAYAVSAGLFVNAILFCPLSAHAQDFYEGKRITLLIGVSVGGGFDTYGRAVAKHIGKHIRGNPAVIVQNMPGAGSLVAVRAVDRTQPRDGTVMVAFNSGLIPQSIIQPTSVNVDFREFSWIGVVAPIFGVCYGYGASGVSSWEGLIKGDSYIVGATGKGTISYVNSSILRVVLGAPVRQILGFPGSSEQRLALERGELNGDCSDYASIPPEWISSKKAHPFVRFTRAKLPEMPDHIPFVGDLAQASDQKELITLLTAAGDLGRPFVMSKHVPSNRVETVRASFQATMRDSEFLADMKRAQLVVHPLSGEQAEQLVEKITVVSPGVIEKAKQIFE